MSSAQKRRTRPREAGPRKRSGDDEDSVAKSVGSNLCSDDDADDDDADDGGGDVNRAGCEFVVDKWAQVEERHKSRWSKSFVAWAAENDPGRVLGRALSYCRRHSRRRRGVVDQESKDCRGGGGDSGDSGRGLGKDAHVNLKEDSSHGGGMGGSDDGDDFKNGDDCDDDGAEFHGSTSLERAVARLRPLTLVHGDFKINNVFVARKAQSVADKEEGEEEEGEVNMEKDSSAGVSGPCLSARVIDWQWCGCGAGALDVAHFLCTSPSNDLLCGVGGGHGSDDHSDDVSPFLGPADGLVESYRQSLSKHLHQRGGGDSRWQQGAGGGGGVGGANKAKTVPFRRPPPSSSGDGTKSAISSRSRGGGGGGGGISDAQAEPFGSSPVNAASTRATTAAVHASASAATPRYKAGDCAAAAAAAHAVVVPQQRQQQQQQQLSARELRRQVALHCVRFVLDSVCFKWAAMRERDMDANKTDTRHGLDRRCYARMEANVRLAVRAARWLLSPSRRF